ncbi:hypothetical protein LSAT2_011229 [Lamellibrachia satsuma]|nr:hypothetical protein LSAT2_011229 [Lamellibrachia satsuma]
MKGISVVLVHKTEKQEGNHFDIRCNRTLAVFADIVVAQHSKMNQHYSRRGCDKDDEETTLFLRVPPMDTDSDDDSFGRVTYVRVDRKPSRQEVSSVTAMLELSWQCLDFPDFCQD